MIELYNNNTNLSWNSLQEIQSKVKGHIGEILWQSESKVNILQEKTNDQIKRNNTSISNLEEEIHKLEEEIIQIEEKLKSDHDANLIKALNKLKAIREKKYKEYIKVETAQEDMKNQERLLSWYLSLKKSKEIRKTLLTLPTEIAPKIKINTLLWEYELTKWNKLEITDPIAEIESSIKIRINEYLKWKIIDTQTEDNKLDLINEFKDSLSKQILQVFINPFSNWESYDIETIKYYIESIKWCINNSKNPIIDLINTHEKTITELNETQTILNEFSNGIPDMETTNPITNHNSTDIHALLEQSINKKTTVIWSIWSLGMGKIFSVFSQISEFLLDKPLTEEKRQNLNRIRFAALRNIIWENEKIDPIEYDLILGQLKNRHEKYNEISKDIKRIINRRKNLEWKSEKIKWSATELKDLISEKEKIQREIQDLQHKKEEMDNLKEGITTSLKIEHIKEIFESVFETNIPVNVFRSIYKKQYINNDLNLFKDMIKKFVDHIKKQQKAKIQQNDEEAQNNILMTVTKRLSSLIHYLKNLANRPDTSNISPKLNLTYKEIIKLIAIKKIFECTTLSPDKKLKYSDIIEYNTKTKNFSIKCENTNDIGILREIFWKEHLEIKNSNTPNKAWDKKESDNLTEDFVEILEKYYIIENQKELTDQINEFCKNWNYKNALKNLLKNRNKLKSPTKVSRHARTIWIWKTWRRLLFIQSWEKHKNYTLKWLYSNDNNSKQLSKSK